MNATWDLSCLYDSFDDPHFLADLEALRGFRFINHPQHPISENRLGLLDSLVRHQLERILE